MYNKTIGTYMSDLYTAQMHDFIAAAGKRNKLDIGSR